MEIFSIVTEVDSAKIESSFDTEVVLVKVPDQRCLIVPMAITSQLLYRDEATDPKFNDNLGESHISYAGADEPLVNLSTILASEGNALRSDGINGAIVGGTGKDLVFKHTIENPSGGAGKLRFHILYRLIDVQSHIN